jgi:hypothetical protein
LKDSWIRCQKKWGCCIGVMFWNFSTAWGDDRGGHEIVN